MTTRRAIATLTTAAAVAFALAGCGAESGRTAVGGPTSTGASTTHVEPIPSTPVSSEANTGPRPGSPCNLFVGLPLSTIYSDAGGGPQCITGASVDTDNTGFSVSACDPLNEATSTKVISWHSNDVTAPDQNQYAAYEDGNIVIVPGASPAKPAILASILLAVGVAGCRPGG